MKSLQKRKGGTAPYVPLGKTLNFYNNGPQQAVPYRGVLLIHLQGCNHIVTRL